MIRTMLPKEFRLRKPKDFKSIYGHGKSVATRYLVLYFTKADPQTTKVGFVVSKKIGKAVVRNKAKRMLREAYRVWQNSVSGYKLIFLARKPIAEASYEEIVGSMGEALRRAKVSQTKEQK